MSTKELEDIHQTKTYEAAHHEESNSEFFCHYQRVKSTQEVQHGLAKMRIKYGDTTHIVTAYRLHGANGPFKQGYLDSGEPGAGRKILESIKQSDKDNVAIFIACYYGGIHMGKRRFEVYKDLAQKASKDLQRRLDKWERANRLRRSNSQSSQLSISSAISQEEEDQGIPEN